MSLPPIRRELIVAAPPDRAFEVFTQQIGQWWPVGDFSVFGADSSVAFEGESIVERAADGRSAIWGEVQLWEPGRHLSFSWHPGREADSASTVTVTFSDDADGTRVLLEHAGWEVFSDPSAARSEYENGWPTVLGRYHEHAGRPVADADAGATWVALMHTPCRSAPTGESLFADPRFAEHVRFLERMNDRGYLVAAGPLSDDPGSGMTILRLPGENREAEAAELAAGDDGAVTSGLFDVAVRPWNVMFSSLA